MAPAAIGTQTNGSVIRPAAFCGVVGYKPGKGVLSTDGILPFSTTLDQPGVFARSVEDAALLVAHLAHSRWTISPQISALKHAPRLVAVRSPVWHLAERRSAQPLRHGRRRSARSRCGDRRDRAARQLQRRAQGAAHDHAVRGRCRLARWCARPIAAKFSEFLRKALEEGDRIGAAEYERALKKREALQRDFSRFLDDYDAAITPPAAGEAPSLETTGDPSFCTIWTLLGVPAVTIPTGLGSHGLPLGLQIVGNQGESNHLLATAMWCERQLPFRNLLARETELL